MADKPRVNAAKRTPTALDRLVEQVPQTRGVVDDARAMEQSLKALGVGRASAKATTSDPFDSAQRAKFFRSTKGLQF